MSTDKHQGKAQNARQELATAEWSDAMDHRARRRLVDTAQALGAVRATVSIALTLSRGGFQRFRQFIDAEEFKELGYGTVVEFLASSDSPFTKNQYYDRLNAFEREGGELFDLLNAMKIPLRDRKLLTAGEIQIDGEEVVLGHEDHEERVSINDRLGIKTLISTLAEKQKQAEQRADLLDKKLKRGQQEFDKQKRELDAARRHGMPTDQTPHGQALLTLTGAYAKLRDEVMAYAESVEPGSAGDAEFHVFHRTVIDTLGNCYVELSDAFGITGPASGPDDLDGVDAADLLEN